MLDLTGRRLLALLVSHLADADPAHPDQMIGYKDAHDQLGLTRVKADWGESLKAQGLENLAQWTFDERKPAITGIIVNNVTHSPGAGYYKLFGRQNDDFEWWSQQIKAAKEYDWTPHLGIVAKTTEVEPPSLPEAVDIHVPPERTDITVSRIIRDTKVARRVKQLHNFSCQICGTSLKLSNNFQYAEAHHIKPLGKPHSGPDIPANIMCLCPNHHVELDYGAVRLDLNAIRHVADHKIEQEFVEYHNSKIFRR